MRQKKYVKTAVRTTRINQMQMPAVFSDLPKDKLIMLGVLIVAIIAVVGLGSHFAQKPKHVPTIMIAQAVTLDGRGDLKPLHMVMATDERLKQMVDQLGALPATKVFLDGHDVDMMVADILFRWSEADMAESGAYGPYIDARVAVFLRRLGILPASYTAGTEIPIKEASNLNQSWYKAFDHYRTVLLVQTAAKPVYDGHVGFDPNTGALTISAPVSQRFVDQFQAGLQASRDPGESMHNFLTFIDQTKGFDRLSKEEEDRIMSIEVKGHAPAATPPVTVTLPVTPSATAETAAPVRP